MSDYIEQSIRNAEEIAPKLKHSASWEHIVAAARSAETLRQERDEALRKENAEWERAVVPAEEAANFAWNAAMEQAQSRIEQAAARERRLREALQRAEAVVSRVPHTCTDLGPGTRTICGLCEWAIYESKRMRAALRAQEGGDSLDRSDDANS